MSAKHPFAGYMTIAEAATFLGISRSLVARYVQQGKLPGHKIGVQVFVEAKAVKAFVPAPRGNPTFGKKKGKRKRFRG